MAIEHVHPASAAAAPVQHMRSGWIERVSGLGMDEFVAAYRKPRRPVVLSDALRDWPACGRFTPGYFLREHADRPVKVRGREQRLGEVLAQQLASTEANPGPYPCTLADCGDLLDQISPRFAASLPSRHTHPWLPKALFEWVNHLEIFFGGPGGEFPYLHYDVMRLHAWITQLYGDKEFTVYAPDQEHLLYVNPLLPWQSSIKDHHHPDYDRYPLLRQAVSQKIVVRAGETLFLPCGWWHTARSLNTTISVAFDQLGPDNWNDFVGDVADERRRKGHPLKAMLFGGWLRAVGPLLGLAERTGANANDQWGQR